MSAPGHPRRGRPRLAYVQTADSFPTIALAEAAEAVCDLVFVLDGDDPRIAPLARLLARVGEVVDVTGADEDGAGAALRAAGVDGLCTLADSHLVWTAEVAERAGLGFVSPGTARRLVDKHAQREALAAAGLAVPAFFPVPPLEDEDAWERLCAEVPFPAVLKPRQGAGSRLTSPAGSPEELVRLVRAAAIEAPGLALVVESYLADDPADAGGPFAGYVSVESLVQAGSVRHLAVTGRLPLAEPFRETGFFMPSALDEARTAAVVDLAGKAAVALGVEQGCLHTEIKLTPDGPVVIEVNGRAGGGMSELLELAAGVAILPLALRIALGEPVDLAGAPRCRRVSFLLYAQADAAVHEVKAVEGLEALRGDPRVREIVLNRGPGQRVDWREGNHGHVFSVLGTAADHDELARLVAKVADEVVIVGA